jgi:hypothetical protein
MRGDALRSKRVTPINSPGSSASGPNCRRLPVTAALNIVLLTSTKKHTVFSLTYHGMQCGIVITHARTARVGLPLSLVHALESLPAAAGAAVVEVSWFKQPTNEVSRPLLTLLCPSHPVSLSSFNPRCAPLRHWSSPELQLGAAKVPCPHVANYQKNRGVLFMATRRLTPLSAALQGPPCVSLARDVLECWGLNVSQMVMRELASEFPPTLCLRCCAGLSAPGSCTTAHRTRCTGARGTPRLGGGHPVSHSARCPSQCTNVSVN